jgi:hypothetical protein
MIESPGVEGVGKIVTSVAVGERGVIGEVGVAEFFPADEQAVTTSNPSASAANVFFMEATPFIFNTHKAASSLSSESV